MRFIVKCSANYYCSLSKDNLEVELAIKLENLIKRGIQKIINISSNNMLYQVVENDILYIEFDKGKIVIVNENYSVSVNKSLNEMYKLLSNNFLYKPVSECFEDFLTTNVVEPKSDPKTPLPL